MKKITKERHGTYEPLRKRKFQEKGPPNIIQFEDGAVSVRNRFLHRTLNTFQGGRLYWKLEIGNFVEKNYF